MHIASGCPKLEQKQYKRRHDNVARRVHWELRKKQGLESSDRWYEHTPADLVENDEVELYWGVTIQTHVTVTHNSPDIFLVEKALRKYPIIYITITYDFNVVKTED